MKADLTKSSVFKLLTASFICGQRIPLTLAESNAGPLWWWGLFGLGVF